MNFLKLILFLFLIGFIVLFLFKKSNQEHKSGIEKSFYEDHDAYRYLAD
jgi:hypothetical protein